MVRLLEKEKFTDRAKFFIRSSTSKSSLVRSRKTDVRNEADQHDVIISRLDLASVRGSRLVRNSAFLASNRRTICPAMRKVNASLPGPRLAELRLLRNLSANTICSWLLVVCQDAPELCCRHLKVGCLPGTPCPPSRSNRQKISARRKKTLTGVPPLPTISPHDIAEDDRLGMAEAGWQKLNAKPKLSAIRRICCR
jgi:hypothetical protein